MYMGDDERAAFKAAKKLTKKGKKNCCESQESDENTSTPNEFKGKCRPGDWTCYRCKNFNYSFRDSCNKCGLF
jgi:hypothetical protein